MAYNDECPKDYSHVHLLGVRECTSRLQKLKPIVPQPKELAWEDVYRVFGPRLRCCPRKNIHRRPLYANYNLANFNLLDFPQIRPNLASTTSTGPQSQLVFVLPNMEYSSQFGVMRQKAVEENL